MTDRATARTSSGSWARSRTGTTVTRCRMAESLALTRLWDVQRYCFPYRSLDRHRATRSHEDTTKWPWLVYRPERDDDVARALFPEAGFLASLAGRSSP